MPGWNIAKLSGAARSRAGTFLRYAAGSVVAFGCSELVLIGSYALFGVGARTAVILAWLAGAVPNYVLNRKWAWNKQGPAAFLRETLPYWAITLGTAAFAVAATSLADGWVHRTVASRGEQSLLFGAVYFAAYGVVFVAKFVLFDKLVFKKEPAKPGPDRDTALDPAAVDLAAVDAAVDLAEPAQTPSTPAR